jgi:thioredoxin-related protein
VSVRMFLRRSLLWAAVVMLASASPVFAAELVMFDSLSCVYCKKFKREAMPAYTASRAAQVLPLRIVQLNGDEPGFQLKKPVRSTPTFVIVERGAEVERFTGYGGREDFLEMMDTMTEAYRKFH